MPAVLCPISLSFMPAEYDCPNFCWSAWNENREPALWANGSGIPEAAKIS
jgi:hypothetical protein